MAADPSIVDGIEGQAEEQLQLTPQQKRELLVPARAELGALLARIVDLAEEAYELTPKQQQVLVCLLDGMSNDEIGQKLGNTNKTVKHHVAEVFRAFDVHTRSELYAFFLGRLS